MNETHYQPDISAFINNESTPEHRTAIAEHILQCEPCRDEHDAIKFGASLAATMPRADAPVGTWSGIDAALSRQSARRSSFLAPRIWVPATAGLVVVAGLIAAFYFLVLKNNRRGETIPNHPIVAGTPSTPARRTEPTGPVPVAPINVPPANPPVVAKGGGPSPRVSTPEVSTRPGGSINPVIPTPAPVRPVDPASSWNVETIAGTPRIAGLADPARLSVGEVLVTDDRSRARIDVAQIGVVELAPNSRVRLVGTSETQHRLALERGSLHAKIDAPPRLFIVDTPSAVAVDLGCEYTLDVDPAGNSKLHVTAGFVSLERNGRESLVPAGAFCVTNRGQGIGTPYFAGSTPAFEAALAKYDFGRGGSASLATIVTEAGAEDTLTLWHLLPRTSGTDREKVFAALLAFVELPPGVTRAGILKLDQKMLETWRKSMEVLWFG